LTGLEAAEILKNGTKISLAIYVMLLDYLHAIGQAQWQSYVQPIDLDDEQALSPAGIARKNFKFEGYKFSRKRFHEGNSAIQFKSPTHPGTLLTGYIDEIWQIPLQGCIQTFLVVQKHLIIPQWVRQNGPFQSMPHFQTTIVDATPSGEFLIIEPEHILTHLAIYKRPIGTYGITTRNFLVICWALNRGRR
ncbi:hypothetical protein B0H10DRAFT_1698527, partial [Mycena sp. CBHHK59/15]